MSTVEASTILSAKGCGTEGGSDPNCRSGRKIIQRKVKSTTISNKSPPLSKHDSSGESKASSDDLNFNDLCKKRSFGVSEIDFEALECEFRSALDKARVWELSMIERHSDDDVLKIGSMLSYLKNIESGFARYNDENHYASIRRADIDGRLLDEAMCGFELAKKYLQLGPVIWKRNARIKR